MTNFLDTRFLPHDLMEAFDDPEFLRRIGLKTKPDTSAPWRRLPWAVPPGRQAVSAYDGGNALLTLTRVPFRWQQWEWGYHVGLDRHGRVCFIAGEAVERVPPGDH